MQYREETDLRAEVLRVARNREKGLRSRAEENAVDRLFVVKGDAGELFGNSENYVEVLTLIAAARASLSPDKQNHWASLVVRQQFGLPVFEPLRPFGVLAFWAMPVAARVVRNARVVALAAFFDMAAERGRTADLDGAHHPELLQRQFAGVAVRLSVLPKNAGQLESRPAHGLLLLRRRGLCRRGPGRAVQPVERTQRRADQLRGNPGVARGGVDLFVPEQNLNDT